MFGEEIEERPIPELTEEDKRTALKIARYSLESVVFDNTKPSPQEIAVIFDLSERLKHKAGVFVTIKSGRGLDTPKEIRGCIGYIVGVKPVYVGILDHAYSASRRDDRYTPVCAQEMNKICITLSVMSPLMPCKAEDVVVGRDGLVLFYEDKMGVYLPQIPIENGWDKPKFLEELCIKAGVSTDKWKDEKAILFRFTAQVFSEDHYPELYKD